MNGDPTYREIVPAPALRPFVACFWQRRAAAPTTPTTHRVLPDGCIDLLFDATNGAALLVGTMTRPHDFTPDGGTDLVAVRLRPGALRHFVRADAVEFNDRHVDLVDVARDWRNVCGRVVAGTSAHRLTALQGELLRRTQTCRTDAIDRALAQWTTRPANLRIDDLANRIGVSRQWFGRVVTARTGLSPRSLARVMRFAAAVDALRAGRPAVVVALEHGYADQAHLCRAVREFAATTPSALAD